MTDIDKMTDEELRIKLVEFGYPIMPITGTTRGVMRKKLKLLMDNQNKSTNRRSLGRFSSDDDSDQDVVGRAQKNRRRTMAYIPPPTPSPPTAPSTTTHTNLYPKLSNTTTKPSINTQVAPSRDIKSITTSTITRTSRIIDNSKDEYDTGSDSDEIIEKFDKSSNLTKRYNIFNTTANSAGERLNQMRARLSLNNTQTAPSIDHQIDDKENTPYLSNFTKRLSELSEQHINSGIFKDDAAIYKSDIKESDTNGGLNIRNYINSYRNLQSRPNMSSYKNDDNTRPTMISWCLLSIFFAFFLSLIIAYLLIGKNNGITNENGPVIPTCNETICITKDDIIELNKLYQQLHPLLMEHAFNIKCKKNLTVIPTVKHAVLNEYQLINWINLTLITPKNIEKLLEHLKMFEMLTFYNEHWGIKMASIDDDNNNYKLMEKFEYTTNMNKTGLIIINPILSWTCIFTEIIQPYFFYVGITVLIIIIIIIILWSIRLYRIWLKKYHDLIINMTEDIIDLLETNADENIQKFMPINHIRDIIIPINEREKKSKLWLDTIDYINKYESRVRQELQQIEGETNQVWRWLGAPNTFRKNRSWQGQAFETDIGFVNGLRCSPTQCLKIRGLIVDGMRNELIIKRIILKKCKNCQILHCGIDWTSNCIYLKCSDTTNAAIAYKNLHGWWYTNSLVTVKYLRLERYMQRYPDSPTNGPPFLQLS